jgi:predicted Zn-dependent peptidase
MGHYEALLGSWRDGLSLPSVYAATTNEQVKAVATKYFAPERRSVVTLIPAADANVEATPDDGKDVE